MTAEPVWLCPDDVAAIHRRMIDEFGGEGGLRDAGLLDSAAAMPRARFGGHDLHPGLPAKAAAYLFHLCRNHAFLDGNKRTALAAAEVFLALNGRHLAADDAAVERLVMGVAAGTVSKDAVTAFFRRHVRRTAPGRKRR
jgi:death-on-curing protein